MDNHSVNGKRCEAIKPGGEPCEAHAMKNSTFCFFHEPGKAEERAAARQAGGLERSRRVAVLPADTPDRPLRSKREVADLLRDTINQIRRGQIDPKVGHIIGYLRLFT